MFEGVFKRHIPLLDRYLIGQFTGPFILAIAAFAIIGIIDIMFYLVDLTVISGVPFLVTLRLLVYKLPAVMVMFFPMAVLFSIMLLLVRMAKDNELTVLKTSGIPIPRILAPLIIMLLLTSYLSYLFNENVVPWTNRVSENLVRREIQRKAPPDITENVVFKDGSGRFFYIKKVDQKLSEMDDILIMNPSRHFPQLITAQKAYWNQLSWTLIDGFVQEIKHDGTVEFSDSFSRMTIHVDEDFLASFNRQKSSREMDSGELRKKINTLEKGGISTRALRVEYHLKKSLPLACLVFGLVGIAFCINFVRSGKDWWGVIVAIIVSVLTVGFYLFLTAIFRALAKNGTILPVVGAWTPNAIYAGIALSAIVWNSLKR